MKNYRTIFSAFFILFILFSFGGCISYYIGYYGYDKNLYRRCSDSKVESLTRKVFIKDLKYSIDIPIIKNVFFEKAYRWGSSYNVTKLLTPKDKVKKNIYNDLTRLYNVSIKHLDFYKGSTIYIPEITIYRKDTILTDTVFLNVFLNDSIDPRLPKIPDKYILKIWE